MQEWIVGRPRPAPGVAVLRGDHPVALLREAWADPLVRRGTYGMGLVAVGSLTPAFLPPGAAVVDLLHLGWLGAGAGRVAATIVLAVGMLLLVDAWLALRPALTGRAVPQLTWLVWSLPVLLAPPLFSRDAYSYAAQGHLVAVDIDPYLSGPIASPGPYAAQVDPMWLSTPAPYGPLALQVQRLVVELTGDHPYLAAIAMRGPALLAVGLMAVALPRLAQRHGVSADHARWLGVINPLVMMHFVGGAHGDAVMVALVVAGLLLAMRGNLVLATMTIAVGACYKQTALLALIGVVGVMMMQSPDGPRRPLGKALVLARHALVSGIVAGATFAAVTWLTGLGWGWIHTLSVPASLRSLIAPPTFVGSAVELLLTVSGLPATVTAAAVPTAQVIGLLVGVCGLAWIAWRFAPRAPVAATAAALLTLCATGPVVHPWYLLWGGVLLAAVRLSSKGLGAVVFVTLFFVCYGVVDAMVANGTWALAGTIALWLLARLRSHRQRAGAAVRLGDRLPLADPERTH